MNDGWFEEPLPTIDGRALNFGLRLSADEILEPAYRSLSAGGARRHLFACVDVGIAARLEPGDVVVAEHIDGTETGVGPACAALAAAGVVALVARRFAPAVVAGASATGLVPITIDTPAFLRTDDRVRLDLDAGKVVNLSSGDRAAMRNASDARDRATLRAAIARSTLI